MLEVLKNHSCAVDFVPEELKFYKAFMLKAVRRAGDALMYASGELGRDREVVLEALWQATVALLMASGDQKLDAEGALTAVLDCVPKELEGDGSVGKALMQAARALRSAQALPAASGL